MKWNNQISHCNDHNHPQTDILDDYETEHEKYLAERLLAAEATITRFYIYAILIVLLLVLGLLVVLFGEIYHA